MRKSLIAALVLPAFFFAPLAFDAANAQDKKADKGAGTAAIKEIASDDKFRVFEVTYKPGQGRPIEPGHRIVRAIKGGTLERDHPDGKKEKVEWKQDQVRINKPAKPYNVKNVGKSDVVLFVVESKSK